MGQCREDLKIKGNTEIIRAKEEPIWDRDMCSLPRMLFLLTKDHRFQVVQCKVVWN